MSNLYIDRKGIEIKLSGEVLICYEKEERVGTIPLAAVDRLYLCGDIKLQASLVAKLGELGIGIIFLRGKKHVPTLFMPIPHNDAERRLAQYSFAQKEDFCLALAKKIILLKLQNQKQWLNQICDQRKDKLLAIYPKVDELAGLIAKIAEQENLPSLRGIEGYAAKVYFQGLTNYFPASLEFQGRNRRPPKDPFNALISLTYTLLHCEAILAIYSSGLDPFIGFYHGVDFGRESLACDLMEPLRPLADRWAYSLFQEKILRPESFSTSSEGCLLGKAGRVQFYQEYDKVVENWRKMLTEACYDLVRILTTSNSLAMPQRRAANFNSDLQAKQVWQQGIEGYYFNQQTMVANWNI